MTGSKGGRRYPERKKGDLKNQFLRSWLRARRVAIAAALRQAEEKRLFGKGGRGVDLSSGKRHDEDEGGGLSRKTTVVWKE